MGLYPRDNPVEIAVAVWPWGAYLGEEALEHGVSCKVSSFRRIGPNTLPPAAKASGQYINSVLAKLEASRAGDDEAILLNEEGYVADGSGENVFAVRDGVLHTPPTTASCLPGITRDTVIRIAHTLGYEVREVNLVRTDLYFADEVVPVRHGRRGDAGRVGRRPADRRPRTDHEGGPGHVLRDRVGPRRAVRRPARVPGPSRSLTRGMVTTRSIPLARPHIGERERELVMDVLRSDALACGEMVPALRARVRRSGRDAVRRRLLERDGRPARRAEPPRPRTRRRGDHVELLVHRLGQRDPARARDAGLRRHRRADAERRPRGRRGGDHAAHPRDRPDPHLRLPVRHRGDLARSPPSTASRSSRTPARRSDAASARPPGRARTETRPSTASTRTSSSRPARAG